MFPFAKTEPDRQWRVHSCFEHCRPNPDTQSDKVDKAFTVDNRPICKDDADIAKGLICANPYDNTCEVLRGENQICFDSIFKVCMDWYIIIFSIMIANFCQLLFFSSLTHAMELTYQPTYLDGLIDPELTAQYDSNDPDKQPEPECSLVMKKCCNEMLAILLYFFVLMAMIIGLIHHLTRGKVLTCLVEFGIAILIDQVKSIPVQAVIWWTVVRRCGKMESGDF